MVHGERFNCLSHLLGLVLAIAGGVWLMVDTVASDSSVLMVGAAIFISAAVLLFLSSVAYHAAHGPFKRRWEKLDHCAIFLLIAGTVTPFVLKNDMNWLSWASIVSIWVLGAWGILRELCSSNDDPPSLWLYLGLGWAGVFAVFQHWQQLHVTTLFLLIGGALAYSAGTYFYRNTSGMEHAHGIWHLFVLCGTVCHFFSIQSHLVGA